jgi:hypothetical protein
MRVAKPLPEPETRQSLEHWIVTRMGDLDLPCWSVFRCEYCQVWVAKLHNAHLFILVFLLFLF